MTDSRTLHGVNGLSICVLLILFNVSTSASQPCPAGFTGSNCSTDIDDCLNNNCSGNGNCSDRVNGFYCYCNDGYYGITCDIEAGPCSPNPCENNGTCFQDENNLVYCNCTSEFQGERCESEKPPKIFTVTLTIIDRIFFDDYKDLTKSLTLGLIEDLNSIFKPFLEQNFDGFSTIVFTGFFQGSVGTIFDVIFAATSEVNATSIVKAFSGANGTNQLRFELLGTINAVNKLHTSTGATDSLVTESSSELEPWIIALIVFLIIFAILLVVIVILVLKTRRKHNARKAEVALDQYWDLHTHIKSIRRTDYSNEIYINGGEQSSY